MGWWRDAGEAGETPAVAAPSSLAALWEGVA